MYRRFDQTSPAFISEIVKAVWFDMMNVFTEEGRRCLVETSVHNYFSPCQIYIFIFLSSILTAVLTSIDVMLLFTSLHSLVSRKVKGKQRKKRNSEKTGVRNKFSPKFTWMNRQFQRSAKF